MIDSEIECPECHHKQTVSQDEDAIIVCLNCGAIIYDPAE